jgi:hypothetical protein
MTGCETIDRRPTRFCLGSDMVGCGMGGSVSCGYIDALACFAWLYSWDEVWGDGHTSFELLCHAVRPPPGRSASCLATQA